MPSGGSLPLTRACQVVRSGPQLQVRVRLLWDEENPVGCGMAQSLRASLSELNDRYKYKEERAIVFADEPSLSDDGRSDETHVIIVLTNLEMNSRWLSQGKPAEQQLLTALERLDHKAKIIVVYDKPKGLDSPIFSQIGKQIDADGIKQLLWSHEALIFRHKTPKCGAVVRRRVFGAVSIRLCVAGACDSRLAVISSTALLQLRARGDAICDCGQAVRQVPFVPTCSSHPPDDHMSKLRHRTHRKPSRWPTCPLFDHLVLGCAAS